MVILKVKKLASPRVAGRSGAGGGVGADEVVVDCRRPTDPARQPTTPTGWQKLIAIGGQKDRAPTGRQKLIASGGQKDRAAPESP